jgi:hypothetical protein
MANAEEVYKSIQFNQEQDRIEIEKEKKMCKSFYIQTIKSYLNEMVKDRVFSKVFIPRNLEYRDMFEEALNEVLVNKEPYYYQWKLRYVGGDGGGYHLYIELKITN